MQREDWGIKEKVEWYKKIVGESKKKKEKENL